MANSNLAQAKNAKNDEFYTQWPDIEREVAAYLEFDADVFRGKTILCPCDDPYESNFFKYFALRFNDFGLKKLIATCYAGSPIASTQLTLFDNEPVDNKTTRAPHKIAITEVTDLDDSGGIDLVDVELLLANGKNVLTRLNGDGDFRSDECVELLKEADIVITNPPFSLFREYVALLAEYDKKFLIIGSLNAITYKEIFPLIMGNKMWLGATGNGNDMVFAVPNGAKVAEAYKQKAARLGYVGNYTRLGNSCWFTNLDHGRRHQALPLMNMADNLKFSRHKNLRGKPAYDRYDNYDAIEVPFTDAIPADYDGVMGVPISFLDKYCPEQFEIFGMCENIDLYSLKTKVYSTAECQQAYFDKFGKKGTYDLNASGVVLKDELLEKVYQRILIKAKGVVK
jgi:hypothetical protein